VLEPAGYMVLAERRDARLNVSLTNALIDCFEEVGNVEHVAMINSEVVEKPIFEGEVAVVA
jgi:hypothetical protein